MPNRPMQSVGNKRRGGAGDRRTGAALNSAMPVKGCGWEDISERRDGINDRRDGINDAKAGTKKGRTGLNDRRAGTTGGDKANTAGEWTDISERRGGINNRRVGINSERAGINITKNQWLILEAIAENSNITAVELSDLVGISVRKIETNIQKLKAKGVLERVGARKNGYWMLTQPDGESME
ncbi:MAG: winged helix-turn-helix transcriptional regulator [Chitinispirillia bacterium]|nr:winged helix-turn-helix transcriptional regulator [Chitinispirillia bacterium]MCL2241187.1 winged helix-turn-helix transcriptional regulator [Chitinispirillia bacterium]